MKKKIRTGFNSEIEVDEPDTKQFDDLLGEEIEVKK